MDTYLFRVAGHAEGTRRNSSCCQQQGDNPIYDRFLVVHAVRSEDVSSFSWNKPYA